MGEQEPGRPGRGEQDGADRSSAGREAAAKAAPGSVGGSAAAEATGGAVAAGKAKLVFGDPLDQQSGDDTDRGWGERPGAGESAGRGLDWYLSQRPPHHGG
ncbi:hypothetical protein GCM10018781_20790 [Kitasatospora indigofera]|uniref:Uncharacterized protein n=1 Tax=Kitasatospora indigofera TaxID=67307 RepID=A0A919FJV7_9ACTN|nr:hypothetical protein [Kitasatospora indigofera]GHH66658.1 hypothetical protein GCM10018781_20790 [Kitasatospora indigofera]